jgi:hypothetical protein
MDVEKICENCTFLRSKKGVLNCSLIKQKVKKDYYCGKFKPK